MKKELLRLLDDPEVVSKLEEVLEPFISDTADSAVEDVIDDEANQFPELFDKPAG